MKSLDEDHGLIISQLLNEEEMENFKKKFDSPVMTNTQKRIVEEFEEDIAAAGGVIDSDDEDENLEIKKKKKQKKLHFSGNTFCLTCPLQGDFRSFAHSRGTVSIHLDFNIIALARFKTKGFCLQTHTRTKMKI